MINIKYMEMALEEAKKAYEKQEVPIGAVLVLKKENKIFRSYNQCISMSDPTAHCEILAIRKASKFISNYRLLNADLYVTIEPCMMCMGAIIHSRIRRLIFGAFDKKWGAACSICDLSNKFNHKTEVISGVLKEETQALIKKFFKERR